MVAGASAQAPNQLPLRQHLSFLKLWSGQTVSLMGSSVTGLALPLTAIYALHAGPAEIGILNAALWLPYIVLGLAAGAWGDRRRRRPVMIVADIGRALLLGAIVALALTHVLTLPLLYVTVFCVGTLTMLFDISYNAYLPTLVRRELLVAGNSRLQASSATAQVAGPGLGGLLVQLLTAPVALVADAASFLASAGCLLWIRDREPGPEIEPGAPRSLLAQVREGLSVVARQPLLRGLVGVAALFNLFSQWMAVQMLIYAIHVLGLTAGTIGAVSSIAAAGALVGSLLASPVNRRLGIGPALLGAIVLECLVLLAVSFMPTGHPALVTVLLGVIYGLSGAGTAASSIVATSIRQAVTPRRMISRMTATYKFITYGVLSIGALCGGAVGQAVGVRHGMLIGSIGIQLTILWTMFSPVSRLRELPTEPDEVSPVPAPTPQPAVVGAVTDPEPAGPPE